jgi:RNA polymerase sigma factor (sigma-70 family)
MSPNVSIRLLAAQPDGRLVDLVGRGNERAFEALVGRYRAPLLRYCVRMGLSEAVAEDVVQHSLLKAWLALIDGTTVRDVRPWLYRIVHNRAISSIRVTREQPGELPETAEYGALGATAAGAEDRMAAREALGHVAALPDMQRNAIVLTAIEGRSHGETASVMGITDGAVRGLVHRARTTMRSAAASLMPPGLQAWLSRGPDAVPLAERSGEITAGAGILGLTGVLAKGALVAATAGLVIAGGSAVQSSRHAGSHRHASLDTNAVSGAATASSPRSSSDVSLRSAATGRSGLTSLGEHRHGRRQNLVSGSHRRGEHRAALVGGPNGRTQGTSQGPGDQPSGERLLSSRGDGSGSGSGDNGVRPREDGGDSGGGGEGAVVSQPSGSGSGDSESSGGHEGGRDSSSQSGDGGSGGDSGGEANQGTSSGHGSGSSGKLVEPVAQDSSGGDSTSGGSAD